MRRCEEVWVSQTRQCGCTNLLVVRVKYGLSLTDGTDSSMSGYDLMKVSVSSGKVVDDL